MPNRKQRHHTSIIIWPSSRWFGPIISKLAPRTNRSETSLERLSLAWPDRFARTAVAPRGTPVRHLYTRLNLFFLSLFITRWWTTCRKSIDRSSFVATRWVGPVAGGNIDLFHRSMTADLDRDWTNTARIGRTMCVASVPWLRTLLWWPFLRFISIQEPYRTD